MNRVVDMVLGVRQKRQLLSIMFYKSKDPSLLSGERDYNMHTRNHRKVKFASEFTAITGIQNSPLYRDCSMWNCLSENVPKI